MAYEFNAFFYVFSNLALSFVICMRRFWLRNKELDGRLHPRAVFSYEFNAVCHSRYI